MKELLLGLDLVGTTVNYTFHKVSRYQITIYKYTQFCPVSWSSQGQEKDRELQNLFVKTFKRYVIVLEKMSGLAWFKRVNWRLHAKEREVIRLKPKTWSSLAV